jgi:hypothetical protein
MEEGTGMTTAQVGYAPVHCWVKAVLGRTYTTVVLTVAWAVLCLLVAQRVTAGALARALPAEQAGSGRSCLRRVRRWSQGPALEQATISPALIRLALPLVVGQPVVALPTVVQAAAEYAQRMPIEETFRDWHSGWGVRIAAVKLPTAAMVDRLIGVVCLTYNLQMHLGQRVSVGPRGQQRWVQWTVTDRVSWFWCGQRLFDDPRARMVRVSSQSSTWT